MKKYHPHAVPPEEKERAALVFVRIDQAYTLLSNVQNRARYDAWIEHLIGGEPMLDEACAIFGDPQKVAQFDEALQIQIADGKRGLDARPDSMEQSTTGQTTLRTISPPDLPRADAQPGQSAGSPPTVEMPEAIREALGLPPASSAG
jgi:curved DNA-binding protein CbpA